MGRGGCQVGRAGRGADLSVRGRVRGLSAWCVGGRLPRGACLSARGDAGGSCPGGVTLSVGGGSDTQLLALRYCGFCWAGLSARAGWELGRGAGFAGRDGKRSWAGLVSDFLSSFPILFQFQIKFKPFEFKFELEFKPHPINKNYAPA